MSDLELMLVFLIQVLVVIGSCKVVGWLGHRLFRQSQVVMEMVTGVILGPSVFGTLAPVLQSRIFPQTIEIGGETVRHPSMQILYVIAQLGLVLYMFIVGLEFNPRIMGRRFGGAIAVSIAGIVAPFALGSLLALTILQGPEFFSPDLSPGVAALYVGAAMSITAFPMLARILYEKGIAGTRMGTLAMGAGATDDAVAWALLAVVLAIFKGDPGIAFIAIGGGAAFAAAVILAGRPLFRFLARGVDENGLGPRAFASTILFLAAGAYITDAIGIYAVFGAFLIGSAMPRGRFAAELRTRIEPLTVSLLLPFFFVYSGLNTKLDLVDTPFLWLVSGAVLLAAIAGKGLACAITAKAAGEPWRSAWAIGALMNARGLMELIILNLGLQQGLITQTTFTVFVIMAIVTTLMASPLFSLIGRGMTWESGSKEPKTSGTGASNPGA